MNDIFAPPPNRKYILDHLDEYVIWGVTTIWGWLALVGLAGFVTLLFFMIL